MAKINQEEYEVLKELGGRWKWIARDKNNTLVMGAGKNERYLDGWFPPVNVGDSLVVDEINAVKVISEWGNLFQFIQWEDEEPHNIAELIEEYEKGYKGSWEHAIEFSGEVFGESEETEVKNIEELKSWFEDDKLYVGEYVKHKINQLDEPEVLSQAWIDEHKESWQNLSVTGYSVPEKDLQNLLVPKQEEVDRAYKDGYEKGKEHATEKQSEETETVARVLVDYLIASAKLKLALKMEVEELEE